MLRHEKILESWYTYMFKMDIHVHSSETSACGKLSAAETVELYHKAGYQALIMTDHYCREFFEALPEMTWEEKVDQYLVGFRTAEQAGKQLGTRIFMGMELRVDENVNDYLVYGITRDFLVKTPKLYRYTIKQFRKTADENHLFISQAHPMRPRMIPADPSLLDAVEVYNGNPRHDSHNDKAYAFAKKNGLLMLSGSDCHQREDVGLGGIGLENPVNTIQEVISAIKTQSYRLLKNN